MNGPERVGQDMRWQILAKNSPMRQIDPMTKAEFYRDKQVASVEWWLDDCALPALTWARLRVFADGTADACFEDGGTLYGFDHPRSAHYFLAEDEYRRLCSMDDEDDREHGVRFAELKPPKWADRSSQEFKYFGTY